jgi:4-hydroxybenzoate polyprenyltransferase
VAGMLVYEQSLVSATDLSRVNEAFFNVNGIISLGVFLFVLADKVLQSGLLLR